jgi:hypothetical protein
MHDLCDSRLDFLSGAGGIPFPPDGCYCQRERARLIGLLVSGAADATAEVAPAVVPQTESKSPPCALLWLVVPALVLEDCLAPALHFCVGSLGHSPDHRQVRPATFSTSGWDRLRL